MTAQDPRLTLNHQTITGVTTKPLTAGGFVHPRVTRTHPDTLRPVEGPYGGFLYQQQTPVAEGELMIYFTNEFGERIATPYVAIDINGELVWKEVALYNYVTNATTGIRV